MEGIGLTLTQSVDEDEFTPLDGDIIPRCTCSCDIDTAVLYVKISKLQ